MPVILPRDAEEAWLDDETPSGGAARAAAAAADSATVARVPVSTAVNDVRHDGPDCIEPVELPPDEPREPSLF